MSLDEFALIRRYFAALAPAGEGVELGIGDDAARRRQMFRYRLPQFQQSGRVAIARQARTGAFQPTLDVLRPGFERESARIWPSDPEISRQTATIGLGELMRAQRSARRRRFVGLV